jgi:hypothetical protein
MVLRTCLPQLSKAGREPLDFVLQLVTNGLQLLWTETVDIH